MPVPEGGLDPLLLDDSSHSAAWQVAEHTGASAVFALRSDYLPPSIALWGADLI